MKRITRSALVPYPAEALFALVDAVEAYPAFLPWCISSQVHSRTADATTATLAVGVKGLRQSFTTRNENTPGREIRMHLVEGPFRRFHAAWRFEPLGNKGSKVEFTFEYELSTPLLARLLEPLFDRMADTMVDAFAKRADALHGSSPG